MKVAILAPSPVPFGPGGAEAVWAGLYRHLLDETPHDVELVKVPVRERTLPEVMAAYRTMSELDLDHFDCVITGKYPAWMVQHPRHVVYLLHPLRGLYDSYGLFGLPRAVTSTDPDVQHLVATATGLTRATVPDLFARWETALDRLGPDHPELAFPGPLARLMVRALDAAALAPDQISRYAAISWTVAGREGYFPGGVQVHVAHPPSDLTGLHTEPGRFFFTAGRLDGPKRVDLLVEGMRHYDGRLPLLIAGAGPEDARLRALAAGDRRVRFLGRLRQAELVDHYARAVGVPFVPLDEDLGLITYEAMASGKPVLTTTDSGGPMEFVRPGATGVVVAPEPAAVGRGLTELERLAADPGTADRARAAIRNQTWSHVAATLLEEPGQRRPRGVARRGKPRLVVTSTFPVWPPRGGGQLRAYHLYGALTATFDVDLLCQAPATADAVTRVLRSGLVEHVVPRTEAHEDAQAHAGARAGTPVTDIVAGELSRLTPEYAARLTELVDGAAGVLLADPFLHPVVRAAAPDVPVVYDAYNCELVLKAQMLPPGPVAEEMLETVREVEGDAARASRLVLTVSTEDAAHLHELYGVPTSRFASVPNGTDLDSVPAVDVAARSGCSARWRAELARQGGPELEHLALFVGSWHEPNNEAARAIAQFAAELPTTGFLLVGSHVDALREDVLPPNVLTLGLVPDLVKTSLLATVDVALAPLLSGSGTNLKVVEYLAAGIPVVSTDVGLRGLDPAVLPVSGVAIEDFPAAIRDTLADPAAVQRAAAAAPAVRARYDWNAIGRTAAPAVAAALGLSVV